MKIRIFRGTFLHLGTPWRECEIRFHVPGTQFRPRRMWGLALKSGFIGWMAVERIPEPRKET